MSTSGRPPCKTTLHYLFIRHDSGVSLSHISTMHLVKPRKPILTAVMPNFRLHFKFPLFVSLLFLLVIITNSQKACSVKYNILASCNSALMIQFPQRRMIMGNKFRSNMLFSYIVCVCLFVITLVTWSHFLLLAAGDVHPNPGPASSDTSSDTSDNSLMHLLNVPNQLSIVHYNVQSISHKVDYLAAELASFDVLTFSETWLSDSVTTSDILIHGFQEPIRKDRHGDNHGGVIVYVKEQINYVRRQDLEILNVECIWLELRLCNNKKVLLGTFYRPPNSNAHYLTLIENSIGLAFDTGIRDIIITGDYNLNTRIDNSRKKIESLCQEFGLNQCIEEPTHFTEHSSSTIDLLLVSNQSSLALSGVGDSFLQQNVRFHCPIFGLFKFRKHISKRIKRNIWRYNDGNFDMLKQNLA